MGLTTKEIEEVFSKLAATQYELENLKNVSIRQSVMLAEALKQKNDALAGKDERVAARLHNLEFQLRVAREDRDVAQSKLRDIQNSAKVLFRLIGQ